MEQLIQLKGDRRGLRLLLSEEAPYDVLLEALEEQFQRGEAFFRGTQVLVDVGERELFEEQVRQLTELLEKWAVSLRAIATTNRQSRGVIHDAGLRAVHSAQVSAPPTETTPWSDAPGDAFFAVRTVRSGQSIRHHGSVTVVGDINPGAEVIAGGDVVIWGRVRGVVHAGAIGNEESIVCALELSPTQLRIANLAARAPEGGTPVAGPEVAHIEEGRIVVEPWDTFRRG